MPTMQTETLSPAQIVADLRRLAVDSLAGMYLPDRRLFAFRLRKDADSNVLEGVSRRYTATVLIALAEAGVELTRRIVGRDSPHDICDGLIDALKGPTEPGELALTVWAARALEHCRADEAVAALIDACDHFEDCPTVELSWALTALLSGSDPIIDTAWSRAISDRLMDSFNSDSGIFAHGPAAGGLSALRSHVSCFADFVYPIQAMSLYHQATGDDRPGEIACRCAETMCSLQGDSGQWWWHFDMRTARVLERYPVYAVHQDSMAPMALFALADACGRDYSDHIDKGLQWLARPDERIESLIDTSGGVIWRKVARREPARLVRSLQAAVSRLHSSVRTPAVDTLFPPVAIDYESRPYHMGWILYAWLPQRGAATAIKTAIGSQKTSPDP